jgi:hypothetical protein
MSGPCRVAMIFDEHYGEKLRPLAKRMHVWVIDRPDNRAVVEEIWASGDIRSREFVLTVFEVGTATPDELFRSILAAVDLHHGEGSSVVPWSELMIVGAELTAPAGKALAEYGIARITDHGDYILGQRHFSKPREN